MKRSRRTALAMAVVTLAGCGSSGTRFSDLAAACQAGSADACAKVEVIREKRTSQEFLNPAVPTGATPGCQQGAEGEVTCI
ncbi:hypothetical protein QO034_22110 [Sedimentitalea sp. JM2-8]|uniref:Lipoprotein n=1 Tax=Sedimentitalea xiamensis TaxID=3050037 RepID=A0ABT7FL97_9RHOB|nr:hypothetical protein [Sedimentitalea xiamensis]MDK3075755.1 hypothetical protein [Sedimentitalea xiamensis]